MIDKEKLQKNVDARVADFHDVLQEISDTLNKGQRKKLLKNKKVKEAASPAGEAVCVRLG